MPQSIQWSHALPAAALGGLIAAIVMSLPLGAFALGMMAAGGLAVVFYRRRNPLAQIPPALGAKLGAVSGLFGFAVFAVLIAAEAVIFRSSGELRAALLDALQRSAASNPDPQAQQVLDYLRTPQGLALFMALALAFVFFVFLVLSSLGGALSAALLRRKQRS